MSEVKSNYFFNIGDKVTAVKDIGVLIKGEVGTVVRFDYFSSAYKVIFNDSKEIWCHQDHIEFYVEPIPKFTTSRGSILFVTRLGVGQYTVSLTKYPFKQKYMKAYMENAVSWANTSEATRLKVGCIIVDKESGGIIAQGCNGTPTGWDTNVCENTTTGETEWFVQHAEVNALNKLRKSPNSSVGSIVFVTHSPCKHCALQLIDAKVSYVYYKEQYRDLTGVELLKKYGIVTEQLNV